MNFSLHILYQRKTVSLNLCIDTRMEKVSRRKGNWMFLSIRLGVGDDDTYAVCRGIPSEGDCQRWVVMDENL